MTFVRKHFNHHKDAIPRDCFSVRLVFAPERNAGIQLEHKAYLGTQDASLIGKVTELHPKKILSGIYNQYCRAAYGRRAVVVTATVPLIEMTATKQGLLIMRTAMEESFAREAQQLAESIGVEVDTMLAGATFPDASEYEAAVNAAIKEKAEKEERDKQYR